MQQMLETPVAALASDPGALVFSPNETLLLWQVADQLALVSLQANGLSGWVTFQNAVAEPDQCSEEFVAGPSNWCGKLRTGRSPVWAPDSRYAAATLVGHAVRIYDFGAYLTDGVTRRVEACVTGCSGDFAFQP